MATKGYIEVIDGSEEAKILAEEDTVEEIEIEETSQVEVDIVGAIEIEVMSQVEVNTVEEIEELSQVEEDTVVGIGIEKVNRKEEDTVEEIEIKINLGIIPEVMTSPNNHSQERL